MELFAHELHSGLHRQLERAARKAVEFRSRFWAVLSDPPNLFQLLGRPSNPMAQAGSQGEPGLFWEATDGRRAQLCRRGWFIWILPRFKGRSAAPPAHAEDKVNTQRTC